MKSERTLRIINGLVATIYDKGASDAEKESAKNKVAKLCWKLLEGVGYKKNMVKNMHACQDLISTFLKSDGHRMSFKNDNYQAEVLENVFNSYGIKYRKKSWMGSSNYFKYELV